MIDEERVYINRNSGKICRYAGKSETFDGNQKRLSLFKGRMQGLVRWAEAHRCKIYFLTLTVKDPSTMDFKVLNQLMNYLRWRYKRVNMPFHYVWVLEPQMKRYEDSGVLAPHWHIAIACPEASLPNVEYLPSAIQHYHLIADGTVVKQAELYKHWGYGQTLCAPSRGSVMDYMAKYMKKALELPGLFGHRFGSSVFTWWKISRWAFECVREFYQAGMDILHVSFTRGDLARLLHIKITDGVTMESYAIESPWRLQRVDVSEN
jgi:hypothetical protein